MNELVIDEDIKNKIYTIRDMQVMIDKDLAKLYGVETKVFNQAVKRNIERFPKEFRFQLTEDEYQNWRSQIVTSSLNDALRSQNVTLESQRGKHRKYLPYVFTEQGVSMLSAVLKSDKAIQTSIHIINSFVKMRQFLSHSGDVFKRLELVEKRQISYEVKTDEKFEKLFNALEDKSLKPKQGIFYDGEMFDAYTFVSDLIRSAKSKIILIDNYVDDSVLTLFSKNQNIDVIIYTKNISKQLNLDLKKYNSQYKKIEIKKFENSHDRFLIVDEKELFHLGASLKDLGKKWFAFSKMDLKSLDVLKRLESI
ncbi:ORF6N domain-containing protein [Arcobacter arenosus]|uniref:ORF6N domain-containing protein n=1 Tax=Arcobacter arenosus TaxID=2576037 RepID=A0A5R8XXS7_9BACT|nr:ORF6N domain-containing protein [Arcobacter arenosus]TLP35523.1 ORF6N domain-containing protein [Arcobacter arenosus]